MTTSLKRCNNKTVMKHCMLAFVLIGLMAGTAWAVPVTFDLVGVNDQSLMVSVTFEYIAATGIIEIDITNNSMVPPNLDPRLTSFAFNMPGEVTGASGSLPLTDGWSIVFTPGDINTPGNYGTFDVAGLTGPSFLGGDPNSGIEVGETFHFEITLTGTGLDRLDEMSFLGLLSEDENQNTSNQYFIARFQRTGADMQGSDVGIPGEPPASVPEPAKLLLLGIGLLGIAIIFEKRLSRARAK